MPLSKLICHLQTHIFTCLEKTFILYDDHSRANSDRAALMPESVFMSQTYQPAMPTDHLCIFCGRPFDISAWPEVIKHYFQHHKEATAQSFVCDHCQTVTGESVDLDSREEFFK